MLRRENDGYRKEMIKVEKELTSCIRKRQKIKFYKQ
jgi:hypothetical protein